MNFNTPKFYWPKVGIPVNEKMLRRANVKARYQDASLEEVFEGGSEQYVGYLKRYLANADALRRHGVGLYFHGSNGTGKTFTAIALVRRLQETIGGHFYVMPAFEIPGEVMKPTYFQEGMIGPETRYEYILRVPYLVIDDFGKEHVGSSEWAPHAIESVLRARYDALLPTFITSNTHREDVGKKFGESMYSILCAATFPVSSADEPHYRERELTNFTETTKRLYGEDFNFKDPEEQRDAFDATDMLGLSPIAAPSSPVIDFDDKKGKKK